MASRPDQLPRLVAALEAADIGLGSRIQPDGSDMRATEPRFRQLVGKMLRFAAQLWVTGPVKDPKCGFTGFRRSAARDLFDHLLAMIDGSREGLTAWTAAGPDASGPSEAPTALRRQARQLLLRPWHAG